MRRRPANAISVYFMSQARHQSARERPVTVIIDDDSETPDGPTGISQIVWPILLHLDVNVYAYFI
jgi:hypothetical protein